MGCPLCKDQQQTQSTTGFYPYLRNSAKFRTPRFNETVATNGTKLEGQGSEEPPIYFLSGIPALRNIPSTPPQKAPRTSGWKDVTLRAAQDSEEGNEPVRPPRKNQQCFSKNEFPIPRTPSNSLMVPNSGQVLNRSLSSNSIKSSSADFPQEAVKQLEEYLRKNNSYTALGILLSALQTQELESDVDDDDKNWEKSITPKQPLPDKNNKSKPPTSHKKERSVTPTPAAPTRKRQSIEVPSAYPPPPPPLLDNESASSSPPPSPPPPMISLRPNRLSPININQMITDHSDNSSTPGALFDRSSPTRLIVNRSSSSLHEEITSQITGPPSGIDDDEEDDDTVPPEITHSVLLKVLQQCSDDFGHSKLVTRRASTIPNNMSMEGLEDFIKSMQMKHENNKIEEDDDEDEDLNSPSIQDLEQALAKLLEEEKIKEKAGKQLNIINSI